MIVPSSVMHIQNVTQPILNNCNDDMYVVTQWLSIALLCQMVTIIYIICIIEPSISSINLTMYGITLVYCCISLHLSNCKSNSNPHYQYYYTGICIFLQVFLLQGYVSFCKLSYYEHLI